MEGELLDWELVHGSDSESTDSITSINQSVKSSAVHDGLVESGVPFREDYMSEPQVLDQLDVYQSGDVSNELGFDDSKIGISSDDDDVRLGDFSASDDVTSDAVTELGVGGNESGLSEVVDGGNEFGVEETIEDSSKSWSDSGGNELVSRDYGIVSGDNEAIEGSGENVVDSVVRAGDESKSKETVWWKMPFALLKYCTFKISPVWSVSMAAAVMGLVLLGRRLYNMKKKAQRFNLKVAIDDKKASQVMSQAARLNAVFTEVRRVPVIRPALPSPSAWPVLSIR